MKFEDQIFRLLSSADYIPMTFEQLKKSLCSSKSQTKRFQKAFDFLLKKGKIAKIKKDKYAITSELDLISGVIDFRANGNAFVTPESCPKKYESNKFFAFANDTHTALQGDEVLARIIKPSRFSRYNKNGTNKSFANEISIKVLKVLKRSNRPITGTLMSENNYFFVVADDPKITRDILVTNPKKSFLNPKPQIGDKVLVNLLKWEKKHLNPIGEIDSVLGVSHTPMAEYKALLIKYNLPENFDTKTLKEANEIGDKVLAKDKKGRLDLTKELVLTIDPDDAKDFDDALSVKQLKDGFEVGVHIADVSHYVKEGSNIDKEANKRGNSTYLVGTVIPMIPKSLSNGLCSLVENQTRLTKSVFLTFDKKCNLKKFTFANSFIKSAKRLTYPQALSLIKNNSTQKIRQNAPLVPEYLTPSTGKPFNLLTDEEIDKLSYCIKNLWKIAKIQRDKRMTKGSLDLDMPESKIYCDEEGWADKVELISYDESHQLVEEFMLLANEAVAKALSEERLPYISRVHDEPNVQKLDELREFAEIYDVKTGDLTKRSEVKKFLDKVNNHEQSHILKIEFLRSLKQACYRAASDGHYGLNKKYYAHFTSPIRRLADLYNHRILDRYMQKTGIKSCIKDEKIPIYLKLKLQEVSQRISNTEQNSTQAERDSRKIKLMEFFERELKKEEKSSFEAVITEVRNHGIFIELFESAAFGFIHTSSLGDDIFALSSDGLSVKGKKTKKIYKVGSSIKVKISSVDRFKRQLDFTLA